MKKFIAIFVLTFCAFACSQGLLAADLPSWNKGPAKQAIIEFVEKVSTPGSQDFVPEEERIAVFDNDGTLWGEQPFYYQLAFALDRIKAMAPQNPQWEDDPILKAAIEGDLATIIEGGKQALLEVIMVSHAGMTTGRI